MKRLQRSFLGGCSGIGEGAAIAWRASKREVFSGRSPKIRFRSLSRRSGMSFLRHREIYQSDVKFLIGSGTRPLPIHRLDEFPTGYSWQVALPQSLLLLRRPVLMLSRGGQYCQAPLCGGWGIFNRQNGEFSIGVDNSIDREGTGQLNAQKQVNFWLPTQNTAPLQVQSSLTRRRQ